MMTIPDQGATWDIGRQIRAALLAELLTGTSAPEGQPPRAMKLRGARITGSLDLEASTLACPLLLQDCYFDEPVNLDEATAPAIRMPWLPPAGPDRQRAAHHPEPCAE